MATRAPQVHTAAPEAARSTGASRAVPARREGGTPSGWGRYVQLLEEERIPESAQRWCVIRAQAFVEAMRPKPLGQLATEEINAFFPRLRTGAPTDRLTVSPQVLAEAFLGHDSGVALAVIGNRNDKGSADAHR